MLHFYKRIVMFALFVLIGADVDEIARRTNRGYEIYEKFSEVSNGSAADPGANTKLQSNPTATSPIRTDSEYGEFQVVQSNLLRVTTPATRLPLVDRGSASRKLRSPPALGAKVANTTLGIASAKSEADDSPQNRTLSQAVGNARTKRKHDGVKKKKKKHGTFKILKILWHHMSKMLPNLSKMQGPFMFMLGMAQANFNNFVMHALMMSKMALISVFMMIMREVVFGDKDNPVKYYNFGYEHPHPHPHHYHHYRKYGYYEPQVTDDYQQYDYKH